MSTVNLEAMHVELLSAEERNSQNPDTFPIPSRSVRESLAPGQIVKLMFSYSGDPGDVSVERMWVIVESRGEDGGYVGVLDNDPYGIPDLAAGMHLAFTAEHVIGVHEEEPQLSLASVETKEPASWIKRKIARILRQG